MEYYFELTKSRLVAINLVGTLGGFMLGAAVAHGGGFAAVNGRTLFAALVGMYFVMAAGCVFNNYIDRDIDGRMERTRGRALVTHRVAGKDALLVGAILGAAGFLILTIFMNGLAFLVSLAGFLLYVMAYSMWWKRRSPNGTVIGALAGAVPPVVGYVASAGRLDLAALLLFLIMVAWQMPHFLAIAIRREDDYAAAKVPVLPVVAGVPRTKRSILIYIIEFVVATLLLFVFHYESYWYLAIALVLGIVWLVLAARGLRAAAGDATRVWARQMFLYSLAVLIVLFGSITVLALV